MSPRAHLYSGVGDTRLCPASCKQAAGQGRPVRQRTSQNRLGRTASGAIRAVAVINPPEEGVVPVRVRTAPCGSKTVTPPLLLLLLCLSSKKKKKPKRKSFSKTAGPRLFDRKSGSLKKKKKRGKEACLGSVLARLLIPWCPYGPARGSSEAVLACPLPYGSPLPSCLLAGSWAKTCVSDS